MSKNRIHLVKIFGFFFVKYVCNVTCLVHFLYLLSTIFYNDCNSSLLRLCEQIFNNQDDLNSLSIYFQLDRLCITNCALTVTEIC